jgi:hypothetical protein
MILLKIVKALNTISSCPFVIGSKEPGNKAILDSILIKLI